MDHNFKSRIEQFLAAETIAVAGYSKDKNQVANNLYEKFKKNGFRVFAVNPKADQITDVQCFKNLKSIPQQPDAVMISTSPEATLEVVKDCIELGISKVWIHCSFGVGSYNEEAVQMAEKNNIEIIPRGCPHMFLEPDGFHKCVKWFMDFQGRLKVNEYA
jgi:predicted CoA-binding protein